MLKIKYYEQNILQPVLHYWGFFSNHFEIPSFGSLEFSFRLRKKENVLLISFLSFFLKSIFLQKDLKFKIIKKSTDLYLVFLIDRSSLNYNFFIIFLQYLNFFCYKNQFNFKSSIVTGVSKEKHKGFFIINSELFSTFIYKLLQQDYIFPKSFYSNLYQMHNLFLNIFFSEKNIKLSLQVSLAYNINKNLDFSLQKINSFNLRLSK